MNVSNLLKISIKPFSMPGVLVIGGSLLAITALAVRCLFRPETQSAKRPAEFFVRHDLRSNSDKENVDLVRGVHKNAPNKPLQPVFLTPLKIFQMNEMMVFKSREESLRNEDYNQDEIVYLLAVSMLVENDDVANPGCLMELSDLVENQHRSQFSRRWFSSDAGVTPLSTKSLNHLKESLIQLNEPVKTKATLHNQYLKGYQLQALEQIEELLELRA